MKRACSASFLAAITAAALMNPVNDASGETKKRVTEYGIQCAAVFYVVQGAYRKNADYETANKLGQKYENLYEIEKQKFPSSVHKNTDFDEYFQRYVDAIGGVVDLNPGAVAKFFKKCERLFP